MIRDFIREHFCRWPATRDDVQAWSRFIEAMQHGSVFVTVDGPPPKFSPITVSASPYDWERNGDL
jgi:hypothetical protein